MSSEKFEQALKKLEKIVEDLESGNVSLEDALKYYEEGVRLSSLCSSILTKAEKKIEVLSRMENGSFETTPFVAGDDEQESDVKKKRAKKKDRQSEDSV